MIVPVLKKINMRPSNETLDATLGRNGFLTQVFFIPNSCPLQQTFSQIFVDALLCPKDFLYYTSLILHNHPVKSAVRIL